jgi:8-oxo-dGTP pyrophosphatase MutT (NUDIX family)
MGRITGCGVLFYTIHNSQLYYLVGKEIYNKQYNDFGGGRNHGESYIDCAARECFEETLGLLGSQMDIKNKLQYANRYLIGNKYYVYLLRIPYNKHINREYRQLVHQYKAAKLSGQKFNYNIEMQEVRWVSDINKINAGRRLQNILI